MVLQSVGYITLLMRRISLFTMQQRILMHLQVLKSCSSNRCSESNVSLWWDIRRVTSESMEWACVEFHCILISRPSDKINERKKERKGKKEREGKGMKERKGTKREKESERGWMTSCWGRVTYVRKDGVSVVIYTVSWTELFTFYFLFFTACFTHISCDKPYFCYFRTINGWWLIG